MESSKESQQEIIIKGTPLLVPMIIYSLNKIVENTSKCIKKITLWENYVTYSTWWTLFFLGSTKATKPTLQHK